MAPAKPPGWFYFAAVFGLLPVVFVDGEMYCWFLRTHDPAELLTSVGIAGGVTGAYLGCLFGALTRRLASIVSAGVIGLVAGIVLGWLGLLLFGVRELFRLGIL